MAQPQCPDFELSVFAGYSNLSAVRVIDASGAFTKLPSSTVIDAQISVGGGTGLTAASTSAIYLQSGPGPVYTDRVILAQLNGAVPPGALDRRQFPLSTILPGVNRPFDWQTDRFNWRASVQDATGNQGGAISFNVCGALPATSTDCCAEMLSKLDEVLAAVGKVYSNQP